MEQKAGLKFHYYWLWSQTGFSLFTFKTLTWHLNCARHCFKCITNNWLTYSLFQPCKIHYYHPYENTRGLRGVSHSWWAVKPLFKPRQPGAWSALNRTPSCLTSPRPDSAAYCMCLSFLISNEVGMATFQQITVRSKQEFWMWKDQNWSWHIITAQDKPAELPSRPAFQKGREGGEVIKKSEEGKQRKRVSKI